MNTVANRPLITTLPHDVLNEIVLSLPAVKSKAPWRDLNSLAYSCRFMSQWKANGVKPLIIQAWCQAAKTLTETKDWRSALLKVVDQSSDRWTRLFREPVLRKLASKRRDDEEDQVSRTYPAFIAAVSSNRESVSVDELRYYLAVCTQASRGQQEAILKTLPRLLEGLSAHELEHACAVLGKSLGGDRELCRRLAKSDVMDKLLNAAGRSKRGFALLELSLLAQDSLPYPMSELEVQRTLSVIPSKKRWGWISRSVPQFFQSGTIIRCLLKDPYCRKRMVEFMLAAFTKGKSDLAKLSACELVYEGRSILGAIGAGKMLLDQVSGWIIENKVFKVDGGAELKDRFVSLISKFANPLCRYAPKGTSGKLAKQMRLATEHAVEAGKLDDASSILCAICMNMRVQLPSRIRGNEAGLRSAFAGAIRKAADCTDLNTRDYCCYRLIELAQHSRLGKEDIRRLKLEVKNVLRGKQVSKAQARHVREYDSASES